MRCECARVKLGAFGAFSLASIAFGVNAPLDTQKGNEGSGHTWGDNSDTNEQDTTGEAKLNTLNMEHKTFTIKQEMNECKTDI